MGGRMYLLLHQYNRIEHFPDVLRCSNLLNCKRLFHLPLCLHIRYFTDENIPSRKETRARRYPMESQLSVVTEAPLVPVIVSAERNPTAVSLRRLPSVSGRCTMR